MEAHAFDERGIGVFCVKPSIDDRDGIGIIKSRVGIERECFSINKNHNLFDIINSINDGKLKWVLVDESQFLAREQVDQLRRVVDELDISVRCYGIRTDFQTKFFEGSKRLMEIADSLEEMKISCECGKKAIFNVRFNEFGNIVLDGEQILIGGNDIYKPMCSKCYNDLKRGK